MKLTHVDLCLLGEEILDRNPQSVLGSELIEYARNWAESIKAEHEACAKICETPARMAAPYAKLDGWLEAAAWCAAAIRARSNPTEQP